MFSFWLIIKGISTLALADETPEMVTKVAVGERATPDPMMDPLMQTAHTELMRAHRFFATLPEPTHWIQVAITDSIDQQIIATDGVLSQDMSSHRRLVDIDLRVGTPELDSTHKMLDGGFGSGQIHFSELVAITTDPKPLKMLLWRGLDESYRASLRRYIQIKSNTQIKVDREDQSADFSHAPAQRAHLPTTPLQLEKQVWAQQLREISLFASAHPEIVFSQISVSAELNTRRIVSTDGSAIVEPRTHYRVAAMAQSVAEDGMELMAYDYIDFVDRFPDKETLAALMNTAIRTAIDLRAAPAIDPYVGPAILKGRAAAVFFHEILGHRIEGHRQKDEDESGTLADKVGEQIFPPFLSITDDPTLTHWNGVALNGHYIYDDEAVKSETVNIVEDGILRNFVMSRAPIEAQATSNGHGRREPGEIPVARQGNLIVSANSESESRVSAAQLKQELIQEIKKQGKPFGLIFDDISGGFTFTGRATPNSYAVKPVTVWKLYPDGREELVRGVDMIGTPLITFSRIAMASVETQVFNGVCGAESGWVPVSAISPDLLVTEVEVQRRSKDHERPPLLEPPGTESQPAKKSLLDSPKSALNGGLQ